jgi:hypothetical protein
MLLRSKLRQQLSNDKCSDSASWLRERGLLTVIQRGSR